MSNEAPEAHHPAHHEYSPHPRQTTHSDKPTGLPSQILQNLATREFVLVYQPIVNMSTGSVVGAETLIRRQHPQLGILPPDEFLLAADDHPLAVELCQRIIGATLIQMESWMDAGLDIAVGVNVGSRQLLQPGFIDHLAALLALHPRVNPAKLELEILETGSPEEVFLLARTLARCREIGISLVLDNFGTGHTSLAELKQLPFHVLKLDPSFLRDILDDPEDLTVLEGVLCLAEAFRRHPIANGVESAEKGLMLLRLGCELAQGSAIARPMQANELPGWAARWRPDPRWTQTLSIPADDRPLLYAAIEHRAWSAAIDSFLKGESEEEPHLSRHQCLFGAWLNSDGPAERISQPAFQSLVALHYKVHALAAGLVKFRVQGRNAEGLARLGELHDLVKKMGEMLDALG